MSTVGIRILDCKVVRILCDAVGILISTSANISGKPAQWEFEKGDIEILERVDFALDYGICKF